jgi:hypothetical protein
LTNFTGNAAFFSNAESDESGLIFEKLLAKFHHIERTMLSGRVAHIGLFSTGATIDVFCNYLIIRMLLSA